MESVSVKTSAIIGEVSVKKERLFDFINRSAGDDHAIPLQNGNNKPVGNIDGKMQTEGDILRYSCKICKRRFACGRALGGHMRIHVDKSNPARLISAEAEMKGWCESVEDASTSTATDRVRDPLMCSLRTNRKRRCVLADRSYPFITRPYACSTLFISNSRACDECGKEFLSWNALLAHMRYCSHYCKPDEEEEEEMFDRVREKERAKARVNGKRSKRQSCSQQDDDRHSHSSVSHSHYNEEEDMANCLVMLATAGKAPSKVIHGGNAGSGLYDSIEHRSGRHNNNSESNRSCSEEEIVTGDEDQFKAGLSHKCQNIASKVHFVLPEKKKWNKEKNNATGRLKVHECSICGRKFPSGQALGGHKRCHRTSICSSTVVKKTIRAEMNIDLNLPAPCLDDIDRNETEYTEKVPVPNNLVNNFPTQTKYGKGLVPCYMQQWWNGNKQNDRLFSLAEQGNIVVGPEDETGSIKR